MTRARHRGQLQLLESASGHFAKLLNASQRQVAMATPTTGQPYRTSQVLLHQCRAGQRAQLTR